MLLNQNAWDREYQDPKLLIVDSEKPHAELVRFLKWLKREKKIKDLADWQVLDLGSGTGRNANFLAEKGAKVVGFEYSKTAVELAKKRTGELGVEVNYQLQDIGEVYPLVDNSIDLILDLTSSNSLDGAGREVYLKEVARVLKPGGYMLVRLLAKDGDKNAKWLIANYSGKEPDTYILPEVGITERVLSRGDFNELYGKVGEIEFLDLVSHYTKFQGRSFKRNFWIGYIHKKQNG